MFVLKVNTFSLIQCYKTPKEKALHVLIDMLHHSHVQLD